MAVSAPDTDNLLNCSICLDEFKVPVSLPCGHTFCKGCIENHWSKALQGKVAPPFMCPQCRKAYTVVPPLHKNVVIDDVVRDRRERRERRQSGDRRWSVELLSAFKQTLTDRERVTTALTSSLLDKLDAAEKAAECFKRRLSASYDDLLRLVAEDHESALRAVDAERDAKLSAIRREHGRCAEVLGGLREMLGRIGDLEATRDDAEFLQGLNDNWQRFMNSLNEHLEQPPSVPVEFATADQLQQRMDELLSLFTASRRAAPSLPETPRAAEAAEGMPGGGGAAPLPSPATLPAPSPALTPALLAAPIPSPSSAPIPSPSSAPLPSQSSAPIPSLSSAPLPSQSSAPLPSPSSAPLPSPSSAPIPSPSSAPIPSPSSAPIPSPSSAPIPSLSSAPLPAPLSAPLPSQSSAPLPSPSSAPLPSQSSAPFPSLSSAPIPSPSSAPLPSPSSAPLPSQSSTPLPSQSSAPLPSPSSAPLPSQSSAPLPSQSSAPLPSQSSAPLPSQSSAPLPSPSSAPLPSPSSAPIPSQSSAPLPSPSSAPIPSQSSAPIPSQSSAPLPSPSSAPLPSSSPAPTPAPSPAMLLAMQEPEPAPPRSTTAAPGHSAWSDVSLVRPNRAELIRRYGRSPCLNPDSAHRWLWVSENRRMVKMDLNQKQPDQPDRFESHQQVLGSDGFSSGRHYWEVDVGKAKWWRVGAAYETIPRKGEDNGYRLGENSVSWCLHKQSSLTARHAGVEDPVRTMATTQRIGLYLDCEAGLLSFYGDTGGDVVELLHSFEHKFQQPLLPAFELGGQFKGNSLSIAKLD